MEKTPDFKTAAELALEDPLLKDDPLTQEVLKTGVLPNGQQVPDIGHWLDDRKKALAELTTDVVSGSQIQNNMVDHSKTWLDQEH